jgi:hypothetical protein
MLIAGASVAARRGWSYLPLLILNLSALALGVEGSVNQLVETVEAVVQQRILDVIIQSLLEILLLVAITGDVSRGITSQLKETVTVLRHHHRSLKERTQITRIEIAQCVRLTKEIKDRSKLKRNCREFHLVYLLKGTELLLLHLHNPLRNVAAPEALTKLDPGGRVAVLSRVGLPPVKSGASQLPCCVQNLLPVVALRNNQLALHRTKPVICLEWVRGVREGRGMTSQEIRTPVTGLRRRRRRWLSVDLLQSLNGVVQGRHHLHLELEELLRGQWWRHPQQLTSTLVVLLLLVRTGTGAPGVHHLIATNEIL